MPILVVLTIFIAIYGLTIDGAKDGLIYYIKPRLSDFTFKTVIAAMGQLFYSMSLAMGIMTVSYTHLDVYKRQPYLNLLFYHLHG